MRYLHEAYAEAFGLLLRQGGTQDEVGQDCYKVEAALFAHLPCLLLGRHLANKGT